MFPRSKKSSQAKKPTRSSSRKSSRSAKPLVNENDIEKPSTSASPNAKACWAIRKALQGRPNGMLTKELIASVRKEWPGDDVFKGEKGRRTVRAAQQFLRRGDVIERLSNKNWQLISPRGGEESAWYEPIANALVSQGICTRAYPCGDDLNKAQWTNPDVVGWIEPSATAKVRNFPSKLVAVEVKRSTDTDSLLKGFAQACAYLDFAHMSWLVVPWCKGSAIIERVERLCVTHGLGLAYAFESEDDEGGSDDSVLLLQVGVYPRCHEPGAKEFSEFLKRLEDAKILDKLGG